MRLRFSNSFRRNIRVFMVNQYDFLYYSEILSTESLGITGTGTGTAGVSAPLVPLTASPIPSFERTGAHAFSHASIGVPRETRPPTETVALVPPCKLTPCISAIVKARHSPQVWRADPYIELTD